MDIQVRTIDLLHRWAGGVLGLLLALIGASGTLLLQADTLFRPLAPSAKAIAPLSVIIERTMRTADAKPDYILFASGEFPFHRIVYRDGSGRYLSGDGTVVSQWQTQWERPELWLFDFHRHLFSGAAGETVVGIVAILGLGFVVTGMLLWWQRRRTFSPRLWPARMTRPAILRHHRDLGTLIAPLLVLTFVTGAVMAIKPLGLALVSPWSSASAIEAATHKPYDPKATPDRPLDWAAMIADAHARFPQAQLRLVSLGRSPDDPILVRLRQPDEWLPNGHTNIWYSAHDGHLITARDAASLPPGARLLDTVYPLHAAKVGGRLYRMLLTVSGVGLILLGTFTAWSFWFRRRRRPPR